MVKPFLSSSPTKPEPTSKRVLSVADLVSEYGLKASFVYHLKRGGKLPFLKIGKKILFRESDFLKFLESHLIDKTGGEE